MLDSKNFDLCADGYDELSKGLSNMGIKFKAISDCGALIEIK